MAPNSHTNNAMADILRVPRYTNFRPFWTSRTSEASRTAWWPPECNVLNGDIANPLVSKDVPETTVVRTRKIKLNPSRQQRLKLDSFAHAARRTYNACVEEKRYEWEARKITTRIFDRVLAIEVAQEFTMYIFHNVLRKHSVHETFRGSAESEDQLASRLTACIFRNVLRGHRFLWKESRSLKASKAARAREFVPGKLSYHFRDAYVTAEDKDGVRNPFIVQNPYLRDTPKVIRQQAAFQAAAAFKSAFSNLRNGNIKRFNVRFRSRKHENANGYTLGIEKFVTLKDPLPKKKREPGVVREPDKGWSLMILERTVGKIRFFETPPFQGKPPGDCSIHKDSCGDYWLLVPIHKRVKKAREGPVLAIDPGGVVPFACYSPSGRAFFEGVRMNEAIAEVQTAVSILDKRMAKAPEKLRRHYLARRRKLFRKYERVRDDWHWKILAGWTREYGGILLPHLQTRRLSGGLRNKSNRGLFGISHWKFLNRAYEKCRENSRFFAVPNEACTTRTCGRCGSFKMCTLTDRTFECGVCGLRCNRDVHAARNIYVRWLSETDEFGVA